MALRNYFMILQMELNLSDDSREDHAGHAEHFRLCDMHGKKTLSNNLFFGSNIIMKIEMIL